MTDSSLPRKSDRVIIVKVIGWKVIKHRYHVVSRMQVHILQFSIRVNNHTKYTIPILFHITLKSLNLAMNSQSTYTTVS